MITHWPNPRAEGFVGGVRLVLRIATAVNHINRFIHGNKLPIVASMSKF